ncbi:hypothetical protein DCCM_0396 [Desulfocucumis palustris]|uniref:Uncharacterized protein n=1 Tax=Desulfocucumis palustris TaxID=1898651 RepID=A0A2L2X7R0_9FIRM|nr:hypothetical protein [Desulfocucumis palustris]GBF32205.1 hypothetical protein DCCM_0396 [Desulfocucumis palustris]
MAGTRGLAAFRGEQLRPGIMRDVHFDVDNKINENKIDILSFSTLEERLVDIENIVDAETMSGRDRLTRLENEDKREAYEAVGGETGYSLQDGPAKPNSLFVFLNGGLQAPGINYDEVPDGNGNVTGITFAPDTMKVTGGVPDVLLVWYKKVL